jgi:hypothetical protein
MFGRRIERFPRRLRFRVRLGYGVRFRLWVDRGGHIRVELRRCVELGDGGRLRRSVELRERIGFQHRIELGRWSELGDWIELRERIRLGGELRLRLGWG